MSLATLAVTGGNGKIGCALLSHLNEYGYHTVNLARGKRREDASDTYITTDLLDAGETYGALAKVDADAVIHLGTIPTPNHHPEHRTYESNVMSTMHVLGASVALDLEGVCLASSINALGSEHQERPAEVHYLPLDESHPRTPDDAYGIAKHALEVTAAGFGRRPSVDLPIASLRYPWVVTEEEMRREFVEKDRSLDGLEHVDPAGGRDVLFSYLDLDDAVAAARLAVEADFEGHEAFWTVAADTTATAPSAALAAEFFPEADLRRELQDHESLIDTTKAKSLLGWTPNQTWRNLR